MDNISLTNIQVGADKASVTTAVIVFDTLEEVPHRFGTRIGLAEANYILALQTKQEFEKRGGIFLFIEMCERLNIRIAEIVISSYQNESYECEVFCSDQSLPYKCRISDAVIISLCSEMPVMISKKLLEMIRK